jgi:hypothetical protein
MPIVRDRHIFIQAARLLNLLGHDILRIHRLRAAQALSLLADSEDFITHTDEHYKPADVSDMIDLKDNILMDLMSDMENRKSVRPLVDAIDKAKRKLKK